MQNMNITEMEALPPGQSEEYADYIVRNNYNVEKLPDGLEDASYQIISDDFAVIYVPFSGIPSIEITSNSYNAIPKCYTYMDLEVLEEAGVTGLSNNPFLNLKGRGTLIAIIDSGIDYTNPVFRQGDTSRILRLWDQSLPGSRRQQGERGFVIPYGREFTKEEIEAALQAEAPEAMVPSRDENGHGTAMAGLAAGKTLPEEGFSGVAPEASLLIVKLKPAKEYLREFYLLPPEADAYQENDIMLAVAYAVSRAQELRMPLSICIGLGSSLGSHTGNSLLETYLSIISFRVWNFISVAAGNEGNARHHFQGNILPRNPREIVELRVGERNPGFVMEFWGNFFGSYSFQLQSPTGKSLSISSIARNRVQELFFVFVETRVEVSYIPAEAQTGQVLLFFRFLSPAPGIWRLLVTGEERSEFHVWLPVEAFLSEETYFLKPSPYETITNPGNAENAMTVTAYSHVDQSLYLSASRGNTADGRGKPDLAAPGVNVLAPGNRQRFLDISGSSAAAALGAGAGALIQEWGIVRGNAPYLSGITIRNYLQRGAVRSSDQEYPSREWGYGKMNVYRTFEQF